MDGVSTVPGSRITVGAKKWVALWLTMFSIGLSLPGCTDDEEPSGSAPSAGEDGGPVAGDGGRGTAGIERLPEGWTEVKPGGRTSCSHGTPFRFYVRPGMTNRALIVMAGGGACWNEATCTGDHPSFVPDIGEFRDDRPIGINDHADGRNPFRDWHHILVPYCTGDMHWGDADTTYGSGSDAVTIRHRGAVNMQAVVDWMKENLPAPEELFVTGSSAGGCGSIMWAPHLARQYPDARITQLSDSCSGVITTDFLAIATVAWNIAASFPDFIPGAKLSTTGSLPGLYAVVAQGYPDMQLSQYDSQYDVDGVSRYAMMGGEGGAEAWSQKMRANHAEAESKVETYRSYVAPSWMHGINPLPEFYTMRSGGTLFVDWVRDLLDRDAENVTCDPHCGGPEVSDRPEGWACAAGNASAPPAVEPEITATLSFAHFPPPIDIGYDVPYTDVEVAACRADDSDCAAPIDRATTDASGNVTLDVPGGEDGFDGYFALAGQNLEPTRIYVLPPLRNAQSPMILSSVWALLSEKGAAKVAELAGARTSASTGMLIVDLLDCNLSWRFDADVELDGSAPTGYFRFPEVVSQERSATALFAEVPPGEHTIRERRADTGEVVGSITVDVRAGAITIVNGVSPRTTQP